MDKLANYSGRMRQGEREMERGKVSNFAGREIRETI